MNVEIGMHENLLLKMKGNVLHIALSSADGRNELDDAMMRALTEVISDPPESTVAIVLSGEGENFCTGRAASPPPALSPMEDPRPTIKERGAAPILALYEAIRSSAVPVACFVKGLASGMGCAIVAASDYAVADERSQFEANELEKQFAPALLMSVLISRVHVKAISRLVLTGRPIDATTALEYGLIGEIVAPSELDNAQDDFIAFMNSRAPQALRGIKTFLRESAGPHSPNLAALAADVLAESLAARLDVTAPFAPSHDKRFLSVDGERIAYIDIGNGPAIVLLHSLGTSSALWDDILPALTAKYRVVAIDARGHGDSTKRSAWNADAVASDVVAVTRAIGLDRFGLVGISMGGLTAIRVAAKLGRRVAVMVLSSAYASVSGAAVERRLAAAEGMLKKLPMHLFARMYVEQTLHRNTAYPKRERLAQQIAAVASTDYLEILRAISTDDVSSLLCDIEVPTLVLNAELDGSVPRAVSAQLTQGIQGAEERTLRAAAHLACVDSPDEYAEVLLGQFEKYTDEGGEAWKS
ncbi:alpha/beta fold hydrolase [Paraburkholderia guartelaensis]|uniref:Alpha/beta fold hydrolase n=1 Tax=Paraburkholderia guartelaensis TaxID=2546446 RepID=A0A4R5LCZ7_9BURK|nr:alpha/beta fold hydrolase [Paraburkholderia guartelaensis]TDG05969.1 alpha/beta fold hydrolase [Paraburkholderia guartelaensis]